MTDIASREEQPQPTESDFGFGAGGVPPSSEQLTGIASRPSTEPTALVSRTVADSRTALPAGGAQVR